MDVSLPDDDEEDEVEVETLAPVQQTTTLNGPSTSTGPDFHGDPPASPGLGESEIHKRRP